MKPNESNKNNLFRVKSKMVSFVALRLAWI